MKNKQTLMGILRTFIEYCNTIYAILFLEVIAFVHVENNSGRQPTSLFENGMI